MSELPTRIEELVLSETILVDSDRLISPFREKGVEGALLWFGQCLGNGRCIVMECVCPPQQNAKGSYSISGESMRLVRREVRPKNLLLLVQVHTHPKEAFFSPWDSENALNNKPGALNLVVPYYGAISWSRREGFVMVELDDHGIWRPWIVDDWERLKIQGR